METAPQSPEASDEPLHQGVSDCLVRRLEIERKGTWLAADTRYHGNRGTPFIVRLPVRPWRGGLEDVFFMLVALLASRLRR